MLLIIKAIKKFIVVWYRVLICGAIVKGGKQWESCKMTLNVQYTSEKL